LGRLSGCSLFLSLFSVSLCLSFVLCSFFRLAGNGLRVAAVGDFGALHCQPAQKFDSSTQLQFYTSPPIEATRCVRLEW
jgi:hypothetical protein